MNGRLKWKQHKPFGNLLKKTQDPVNSETTTWRYFHIAVQQKVVLAVVTSVFTRLFPSSSRYTQAGATVNHVTPPILLAWCFRDDTAFRFNHWFTRTFQNTLTGNSPDWTINHMNQTYKDWNTSAITLKSISKEAWDAHNTLSIAESTF